MIEMFKKKKRVEPKSEPAYVPPAPPTACELAARTVEISALAAEARTHLERLKSIKAKIQELGGSAELVGDIQYRYHIACVSDPKPDWSFTVSHNVQL